VGGAAGPAAWAATVRDKQSAPDKPAPTTTVRAERAESTNPRNFMVFPLQLFPDASGPESTIAFFSGCVEASDADCVTECGPTRFAPNVLKNGLGRGPRMFAMARLKSAPTRFWRSRRRHPSARRRGKTAARARDRSRRCNSRRGLHMPSTNRDGNARPIRNVWRAPCAPRRAYLSTTHRVTAWW